MLRLCFLAALGLVNAASKAQQETPHIDTLRVETVAIMHVRGGQQFATGRSMQLYVWNRRTGYNVIYRPTGVKYLEGYYKERRDSLFLAHGPFTFYNVDGSIMKQGEYRNGSEVGTFLVNDDTGRPLYMMDFDHGKKSLLYPERSIRAVGKVYIVKSTGREFQKGKWKFYCPDGRIRSEGKFNEWGKIGPWNHYGAKGSLARTERHPRHRFKRSKPIAHSAFEEEAQTHCEP